MAAYLKNKNPKYELIIRLAKNAKMTPEDIASIIISDIGLNRILEHKIDKDEEALLLEHVSLHGKRIKESGRLFPGLNGKPISVNGLLDLMAKYMSRHTELTLGDIGWSKNGQSAIKLKSMKEVVDFLKN